MNSDSAPIDARILHLLEQQRQQDIMFATMPPKKLLWKLSGPAMISFFASSIYAVIDSLMIAEKDPLQSSAVVFCIPITVYIPNAFSLAVGLGVNSVIARSLGQKDIPTAKKAIAASLQLSILIGILYPVIMLPLLPYILPLLGTTPELIDWAKTFCYIAIGVGTTTVTLSLTVVNCLQAQGMASTASKASIVGTLINTVVDPLIIFVANKGIIGSAIAIVLGSGLTSIFCLYFLCTKSKRSAPVTLDFSDLFKYHKVTGPILSIGMGGFFTNAAFAVSLSIANHLISYLTQDNLELSAAMVAVLGCSSTLINIFYNMCYAINSALLPTASFALGSNLTKRFAVLCRYAILWETYVMIVAGILLTALAKYWPYIFYSGGSSDDIFYREQMTKVMYRMMPTKVIVGVTMAAFSILQAKHMTVAAAVVAAAPQLIVIIPLLYILCYTTHNVYKFILSYAGADIIATLAIVFYLCIIRKKLHFTADSQEGPLCRSDAEIEQTVIVCEPTSIHQLEVEQPFVEEIGSDTSDASELTFKGQL